MSTSDCPSANDSGFLAALDKARKGASEGGIPVGACLVSKNGEILGKGRNMRVQKGSATLHVRDLLINNSSSSVLRYSDPGNVADPLYAYQQGETSALENSGRLPASAYEGATMYATLSPCDMCTGACLLYKVKRVVIGENETFMGGEDYLKKRGVEVVVLDNNECKQLMREFIEKNPDLW